MLTEKELAKRLSEFPGLGVNSLEFIYNCERATGIVSRLLERIAELEQRPTHESIVQWLAEEHGTAAVPRYRAEFMEPTDAD